MTRRPALFTQADVSRALRAAMAAGAGRVEVTPGGSIVIHLDPARPAPGHATEGGDDGREIVL
jgi:hypothetical protein